MGTLTKTSWRKVTLGIAAGLALTTHATASDEKQRIFSISHYALKQPVTRHQVDRETRPAGEPQWSSTMNLNIRVNERQGAVSHEGRILHIPGTIVASGVGDHPLPDYGLAGPAVQHLYAMISDILYSGAEIRASEPADRHRDALFRLIQTAEPLVVEAMLWDAKRYDHLPPAVRELSESFHRALPLMGSDMRLPELLLQRAASLLQEVRLGGISDDDMWFDSKGRLIGFETAVDINTFGKEEHKPSEEATWLRLHIPPHPGAQTIQQQFFLDRVNALVGAVDNPELIPQGG